ncbi:MAG: YybS family protein [Clostridia bacterium]|jgi:uncharacterized protein YybS (DUF2232 family)|nr:YybS family protein [Clostridia bacterium]
MAVFTAILAAAGLYIPLMQFVVFFVWTIPSVLVIVRHGLMTGLVSLTAATLLIFMLAGPVSAIMAAIQIGSLAVIYGIAFRRGWKAGAALFSGAAIMMVSTLLLYYLVFIITGINNLDIASQLQEALEPTIQMYKDIGLINPEKGVTEEGVRQIMQGYFQSFTFFFPGMFALSGAVSAFLTFFASQKILRRFQIEINSLPPFRLWRLPWWIIWGLIAGLICNVGGMHWGMETLSKIGSNIVIIYVVVLFVLGLSTLCFFLRKYLGEDLVSRVMLPLIIFFLAPYSVITLAVVGLVDLFFNYRRFSGVT